MRALLFCAALALAAGAASAQEESNATLSKDESGALRIEASFYADAPVELAWEVLTDYERIDEFVGSVTRSVLRPAGSSGVLLEQEAIGRAFLVSRKTKVLLELRESPPFEIRFEDKLGEDFRIYEGAWRLSKEGAGVRVRYELLAEFRGAAPGFALRAAFRKGASSLIDDIRREIERRQALP